MQLLRNCEHFSVFEMVGPALEGIRCLVPMPKEWQVHREQSEKNAVISSISYCLPVAAEPGAGVWIVGLQKRGIMCLHGVQSHFERSTPAWLQETCSS